MVMGTNQLLTGIGYFSTGYFISDFGQVWAGWVGVLVTSFTATQLLELDLDFDKGGEEMFTRFALRRKNSYFKICPT